MTKTQKTYPIIERAGFDIEIPHVRNGRPGYKWVTGWVVRFSESHVSLAMAYLVAIGYLAKLKTKP